MIVGAGLSGLTAARHVVGAATRRSCSRPATASAAGRSTTRSATARWSRSAASGSDRPRITSPRSRRGARRRHVQDLQQGQLPVLRERQADAVLSHAARSGRSRRTRPRSGSSARAGEARLDGQDGATRQAVDGAQRPRVGQPDVRDVQARERARIAARPTCSTSGSRRCSPASRATSRCCTSCSTSTRPGNERTPGTFERLINTAGGAQDSRFVGGSQQVSIRAAQRARQRA